MRNLAALAQLAQAQRTENADRRSSLRAALRSPSKVGTLREQAKTLAAEAKVMQQAVYIPGFFPTPPRLGELMLDYARITPGIVYRWLEPQAGKGNLAALIRDRFPSHPLRCIELAPLLCQVLTDKGFSVIQGDCLQHQGTYDRILMNPPFENGQDAAMVRHAYSLLADNGVLVSILSCGPFFRSDRVSTDFRAWLETVDYEIVEDWPADAFKHAERSTGVQTKLLVITK